MLLLASRVLFSIWNLYVSLLLCMSKHSILHSFFFQICYYLSLKLNDCNRKLKLYATIKPQNLDLMEIIGEHNEICKEIILFKKFWNFYLFIDAIIYSSQLAFMLFISFFTNIVDFLKFIFPSFSVKSVKVVTLVRVVTQEPFIGII
jgi:hypothetical protein